MPEFSVVDGADGADEPDEVDETDGTGEIHEIDEAEDLSGLDPEFIASLEGRPPRVRRALIELERLSLPAAGHRPMSRELIAAVEAEVFTGVRLLRLRLARTARDAAIEEFDAAVIAAREVGYSWADLSRIVGVSRQALQQRFGEAAKARPGGLRMPRPR